MYKRKGKDLENISSNKQKINKLLPLCIASKPTSHSLSVDTISPVQCDFGQPALSCDHDVWQTSTWNETKTSDSPVADACESLRASS